MTEYSNTIYVYTTETYREFRNWRKIGQTVQESAEIRVAQQDGTSNPEPLLIEKTFEVPGHITDYKIHDYLQRKLNKKRVRIDKSREWFECAVEDVSKSINALIFGVSRPDNWSMRQEQKECHDKAVSAFAKGTNRFLINAKMRFGKTFVAYQIAKTLAEKTKTPFKILVLTYKPTVGSAWKEDLENHVDFDGWKFQHAKDCDGNAILIEDHDKPSVLFASFQDMNDMSKGKWSKIKKQQFDLLIIDEQHYGIETERAKETLASLNYNKLIEVSGTPLNALMSGKFLDHEIYTWTYADEQKKKEEERFLEWKTDIYRWLPTMNFMVFSISENAKEHCSYYTDEEGFTMQKMFASEDGETFIDESAVTLWLEEAYGLKGRKTKSPVRQYNSNHMVWKLPSVNSCNAMKTLLERLEFVKHTPIVVSGSKGENLESVHSYIQRHDKTVTLSCGSLMTGTTVPEWDMIFMLDGGKSPQEYFQTIFRVQSMNKKANKEKCYVVDYNPQRNLQMVYEYAFVMATANGKSTNQNISEFLEFAPIMDHTENEPVRKNIEDVLNEIAHSSSAIEKFGSQLNVDYSVMNDDVKNILTGVNTETGTKRESIVNDNDIDLGKNKKNLNEKSSNKTKPDLTKKELQQLQRAAITVIQNIPNYLWVEEAQIDDISDIFNFGDEKAFEDEVGITLEKFKTLCDLGFINKKRVEQCILAFQQSIKHNVTA